MRTLSLFHATARKLSRLMSARLVSVTVMTGGLDALGEAPDPLRRFRDLALVHRQRDAQMSGPAGAEAFAGHGDDCFLGEEPARELIAREAGPADIDHHEHAAFRHARRNGLRPVQALDQGLGTPLIAH